MSRAVTFTKHARQRMREMGVEEAEVRSAIVWPCSMHPDTDDRADALAIAGQMLDDAHDVFMVNQSMEPAAPLKLEQVYIP